jgi:hypothetical protein
VSDVSENKFSRFVLEIRVGYLWIFFIENYKVPWFNIDEKGIRILNPAQNGKG